MHNYIFVLVLGCVHFATAQQNNVTTVRDGFITIATDARAAGQGDIGVATAADAFSQFWNPSKIIFSTKKMEVGLTQIVGSSDELESFSQVNLNFYNQLNERSAYGISFKGYTSTNEQLLQATQEIAVDGSYSLRLSETFAMSVGGRYIILKDQAPFLASNDIQFNASLYGIDVSGCYYGNEMGYTKFNGRWRAGFNFSNLRSGAINDNTFIEIYAPATLRVGVGFDFIFSQDQTLGITTEYKSLLDSYVESANGEPLIFGLEGSVAALGLEYSFREKLVARTGYSQGINRLTDSFFSLGLGLTGRQVTFDIAGLLGLAEQENPIRQNIRVSLTLDIAEILFN